jgi:iron(III) transport system permease protein
VRAPRPTGPRRPSRWTLTTLAIAATLAVVSSLTQPAQGVWAHLWRTQLVELTLNTLALLAGVGLGTFVLGTALGWLVTSYEFPGRRVFEWALVLPLALPAYVIGFAVLGLLDYAGPLQSALRSYLGPGAVLPNPRAYWGVVLVMTLVFYPYVYLLARTAFREQGAATLETARVLGRSRWQAFRQVSLPMARPSLVAGTSLAMMEALADFGTVATFGYRTLTEAIYRVWYGMFDRIAATQLASLLLLFALALLVLERSLRGRARFVQSQRRGLDVPRVPLTGWSATGAVAGCLAALAAAVRRTGGPAAALGARRDRRRDRGGARVLRRAGEHGRARLRRRRGDRWARARPRVRHAPAAGDGRADDDSPGRDGIRAARVGDRGGGPAPARPPRSRAGRAR